MSLHGTVVSLAIQMKGAHSTPVVSGRCRFIGAGHQPRYSDYIGIINVQTIIKYDLNV